MTKSIVLSASLLAACKTLGIPRDAGMHMSKKKAQHLGWPGPGVSAYETQEYG